MLELLIAFAIVLLFSAWFASFFDRRVRLGFVPWWRRFVAWSALFLLTVSLIELIYFFSSVRSIGLVLPFFAAGFVLAVAAFLTCWFGSRMTLACLLPSTLLVGTSWFLVLARFA